MIQKLHDVPDDETSAEEKGPKIIEETHEDERQRDAVTKDGSNVPTQQQVGEYLLNRKKQEVIYNLFLHTVWAGLTLFMI